MPKLSPTSDARLPEEPTGQTTLPERPVATLAAGGRLPMTQLAMDPDAVAPVSLEPGTRLHVAPNGDLWCVTPEGTDAVAATARTKAEALSLARDLGGRCDATVVVHRANGTVERTFSPSA